MPPDPGGLGGQRHDTTRRRALGAGARLQTRLEDMRFRTAIAVLAGGAAVLGVTIAALVLAGNSGGPAKPRPSSGGHAPLAVQSPTATRVASPSPQPSRSSRPVPQAGLTGRRSGSTGAQAAPSRAVRTRPVSASAAPERSRAASAPSVTLAASPNPAITAQSITYIATVNPRPANGTVAFADGGIVIPGCGSLPVGGTGIAHCQVSYAQGGTHTITAVLDSGAGRAYPAQAVDETVVKCGHAFQGCNLSGLDLGHVSFAGADLQGANLQNANLAGADLSSADLAGANLQNANLAGADLSGADLAGANLSKANLADASLNGATAKGANLGGAIWSDTTCPDGTNSDGDGGTCQKNL